MRALLLKDTLAQKPNIVIGGLYSLIFFVAFRLVGGSPLSSVVYVFCGVAVGYTILLGSYKLDVNDTPRFMFSMPISRRTAVNEKFVLLLLGTLYGTACAVLIGAILKLGGTGWATGLINGIDALRILSGMLLLSFLIPLYFWVGHTIIRYVLIIGLGTLVAGQVAGMLVLEFRSEPGRSIPFLDAIFGWMSGGGDLNRTLVILAVGLAVASLSYVASHLVWRRHEI